MDETTVEYLQQIEYWQQKTADYKWLFVEQKDLTEGYRNICKEYAQKLSDKRFKIHQLESEIVDLNRQIAEKIMSN